MDINRINSGISGANYTASTAKPVAKKQESEVKTPKTPAEEQVKDQVSIKSDASAPKKESKTKKNSSIYKALEQPSGKIEARNRTPVVIVHGTMSTDKRMINYKDAAQGTGHPVDLQTFITIKDGHKLEESGHIVSQQINEDRVQATKLNLQDLKGIKNNPDRLKEYFKMDANLYGDKDNNVNKIAKFIPGVIDEVDSLLKMPQSELNESFSTRMLGIENKLTDKISGTGFGSQEVNGKKRDEMCAKVSREIINSIAPRVILVGHSMGGFLSYTMALNPKESPEDNNPFRYDGGNGISTLMTLSSPIKSGTRAPLPRALYGLSYDLLERHYLNPMENTPGMQFAMLNPFFAAWYSTSKAMTKQMHRMGMEMSTRMMTPMIHAKSPGYKQIEEGSDFIKEHVKDKNVPSGITAIAVSSIDDGVSEQERSQIDDSKPNAHNLDAEANVKPEELTEFMYTKHNLAHVKMAEQPKAHWQEFIKEQIENPEKIPSLLHRSNDDGFRWNCLQVLFARAKENPEYFSSPEYENAYNAVKDVASERLPFTDSPSYVAKQIIDEINNGTESNPAEPTPGNWILSTDVDIM